MKTALLFGASGLVGGHLLNELIKNDQTVFRYCNDDGEILSQFPTNPNGSYYNLAAVSNSAGNILAMMPHPERTNLGDKLFSSMREFIKQKISIKNDLLICISTSGNSKNIINVIRTIKFSKHRRAHSTTQKTSSNKNSMFS